MAGSLLLNLSALAALVPAAVVPVARHQGRDAVYWAVVLLAVAGPSVWAAAQLADSWHTGVSVALWLSIAVTMAVFALVAVIDRHAWRLTPLLLSYLLLLGILATLWQQAPERPLTAVPGGPWLLLHILVSLVAYALLTVAAVAGCAVMLQEHALKAKRQLMLARQLPSIADSEGLEVRLLATSGVVLAVGLATGMATGWIEHGKLLRLDHKTVLSLLTLAAIIGLLITHGRTGIRGRRAARLVLVAYVLLTLAYPGVKFVTDVLVG